MSQLKKSLDEKIGFYDTDIASKLVRYLMEQANAEGKVVNMADSEFKGQRHFDVVTMKRKDLHERLLASLPDYMLNNGMAVTSLLRRVANMFEELREDLLDDLRDHDEEDEGAVPFDLILKVIKIQMIQPDEELTDFLKFLAMRHSKSLEAVNYKKFTDALHEDFNLIEDERSIWLKEDEPLSYEPSDDEGEL